MRICAYDHAIRRNTTLECQKAVIKYRDEELKLTNLNDRARKDVESALAQVEDIQYISTFDPLSQVAEALEMLEIEVRKQARTGSLEIRGLDDGWIPFDNREAGRLSLLFEKNFRAPIRNSPQYRPMRVSAAKVYSAVDELAHPIDPMLERMQNLPDWDGVERVETFLIDYTGALDTPITRHVTIGIFLGIYYRTMQAGCHFDYLPILVGPQGVGKSALCKLLAFGDPALYSDSFRLTGELQKNLESIGGAAVVEAQELRITRFADREDLKQFITTSHDIYRRPYHRTEMRIPRRFMLLATTNPRELGIIPQDESGSRRYVPIETPFPNPLNSQARRDEILEILPQLYAEAVASFKLNDYNYIPHEMYETLFAENLSYEQRDLMLPDQLSELADRIRASDELNEIEAIHNAFISHSAWLYSPKRGETHKGLTLWQIAELIGYSSGQGSDPRIQLKLVNELTRQSWMQKKRARVRKVEGSKPKERTIWIPPILD